MNVIIGTTLHEQLLLILSPYLATRGKLKRKLVIIDVSFSFLFFSFFAGNDTAWIHPDERRD
jgi:hypothetical protein